MDRTDRKILRELQLDAKQSNAHLAERVGLSESACLRRVRLLEQVGVIERYTAVVSPAAVGLPLAVFITISLTSQSQESLSAFEAALAGVPEILECHLMTGTSDYFLRVVVADVDDLERLHSTKLTRLPCVARVNSSLALRCVVRRTTLPL